MGGIAQTVKLSSEVISDGLGPMQRFENAKKNPEQFIDIVCQRVIDGESLAQIAKSMGLPKLPFMRWVGEEYGTEYESALRMAGDEDGHAVVRIADESNPDEAAKTKLMIGARQWRSSRWFRERYGEHTKVEHSGNVNLIALLGSLPNNSAVEEKTVDQTPALNAPAAHEMI